MKPAKSEKKVKRKGLENETVSSRKRNEVQAKNGCMGVERNEDKNVDDLIKGYEGLVFEDPFGDEFEEEVLDGKKYDSEEEEELLDGEATENAQESIQQSWKPEEENVDDNEELEHDPTAYVMYHSVQPEWPALSFDFIRDEFGDNRQRVSGIDVGNL